MEGGKQRKFVFHEDDRRFLGEGCIEWASPRFLKFNGPRGEGLFLAPVEMPKSSW